MNKIGKNALVLVVAAKNKHCHLRHEYNTTRAQANIPPSSTMNFGSLLASNSPVQIL